MFDIQSHNKFPFLWSHCARVGGGRACPQLGAVAAGGLGPGASLRLAPCQSRRQRTENPKYLKWSYRDA